MRLLFADLVFALDKAIGKRSRMNMAQPDVRLQWSKKRNAFAKKNRDSCDNNLSDQTGVKKTLNRLSTINIHMIRSTL